MEVVGIYLQLFEAEAVCAALRAAVDRVKGPL